MPEKRHVRDDFYAIELTWFGQQSSVAYFKSNRYSAWTGNLQVEFEPEAAKRYKTSDGARKAIGRMLAGSFVKKHHEPRVVRYSKSIVETIERVPAAVSVIAEGNGECPP
jgi:hypothetical protein